MAVFSFTLRNITKFEITETVHMLIYYFVTQKSLNNIKKLMFGLNYLKFTSGKTSLPQTFCRTISNLPN